MPIPKARLINDLWQLWQDLATPWKTYLHNAGWKSVSEATFADDLQREIAVDFTLPGLEDLARETKRAIEPGDPARSLLYHVLASPRVRPTAPKGRRAAHFWPTLQQIEIVENYVYSVNRPSIPELRARFGKSPLALLIFAVEYCPAVDTFHKRHADLCFSRTGIARVGTLPPNYVGRARGFSPQAPSDIDVAVLPCRYAAFLSVQVTGDATAARMIDLQDGDDKRQFWLPVHKLFDGDECLAGITGLELEWRCHHVNQKIRKVHEALENEGHPLGFDRRTLEQPPYTLTEELAEFSRSPKSLPSLLTPVPHDPLIHPATKHHSKEYATFRVPSGHRAFSSTMWFPGDAADNRPGPEFVTSRYAPDANAITRLDPSSNAILGIVQNGDYQAVHFVDHTAEGWVTVKADALAADFPDPLSAYSIIGQPDFFPFVRQRDLMDWWKSSAPAAIKNYIWPDGVDPDSLASTRLPPNFELAGSGFTSTDNTITAVVSMWRKPQLAQTRAVPYQPEAESTLPVRSTDVFGPGWDLAANITGGVRHLAHYGLGSPFPEDTMVCASSGAFWPAASPDTARIISPGNNVSVTPILDEELVKNSQTWDTLVLPKLINNNTVRYQMLAAADYVGAVWKRELRFGNFIHVTLEEYIARTLVIGRIFQYLKVTDSGERGRWGVLHFTKKLGSLPVSVTLNTPKEHQYMIQMFQTASISYAPDASSADIQFNRLRTFYATPATLYEDSQCVWTL